MADFDPTNPYVREAIAAGVNELWIADFIRNNANDYHRILKAAAGDAAVGGTTSASSLVLASLPDTYQAQVRPEAFIAPAGAVTAASLFGGGSPLLLLAVGVAAWFIYKKL